ncbi:MAG: hypothetical protein WCL14_08375 [Bacteroidota bacterium]
MENKLDIGNIIVISLTVIVFVIALFLKGFTHEILLEVGVLLVSVKLIMITNKISTANQKLLNEMKKINKAIDELKNDSNT